MNELDYPDDDKDDGKDPKNCSVHAAWYPVYRTGKRRQKVEPIQSTGSSWFQRRWSKRSSERILG